MRRGTGSCPTRSVAASAVLYAVLSLATALPCRGAGVPERFTIANVTADNASVSWTSAAVEAGVVEFAESVGDLAARKGTFGLATDDGGGSRVHHVTLGESSRFDIRFASGRPALAPGRTYIFDVVSGETRYDNQGAHFTFRTAARQSPRLTRPEPAAFYMLDDAGFPVADALLLYRLEGGGLRSQQGSVLIRQGIARILDLAQLLADDLGGPWTFSGTQELVVTVSGPATDEATSARVPVQATASVRRPALPALPRHNTAPVADAGPDRAGALGLEVRVSGAGSDSEGDSLRYLWTADAGNPGIVTLTGASQAAVAFTPAAPGRYGLTLRVTDSRGASAIDTMSVTVSGPVSPAENDHASAPALAGDGDTLVAAATPSVGKTLPGTIAAAAEQDWFRLEGRRGNAYAVTLTSRTLDNARAALFSTDGATQLHVVAGNAGAELALPVFRPAFDGTFFVRVTASNGSSSGAYTLKATVTAEALAAPPATELALAPAAGGVLATVRTGGTTVPISSMQLMLAYDGSRFRAQNFQAGAAAGGLRASLRQVAPSLISLDFVAAAPVALLAGNLATVELAARGGVPARDTGIGVLSVSAATASSNVTRLRPVADAGLPIAWSASQLELGRVVLDGRRSAGDAAGRRLTYRWRQTGGPAVALDDPTLAQPRFAPPRGALYRFALVVSDGILASTTSTVWAGVEAAAAAPSPSVRAVLGGSRRSIDATTSVLHAATGESVLFDASESADSAHPDPVFTWTQIEGPAIELSAAGKLLSFVPAQPGLHGFELSVRGSNGVEALPAAVRVHVTPAGDVEVPLNLGATSGSGQGVDLGDSPQLSATAPLRAAVGQRVRLSALLAVAGVSRPQTHSFYWLQRAGPAVTYTQIGALEESARVDSYIDFTPQFAGAIEFECRAKLSPSGAEASRSIRVVASDALAPVPDAAAQAGATRVTTGVVVQLSGVSAGRAPGSVTYRWVQVAGPLVTLTGGATAAASFVAPAREALLGFQLFADAGVRSAPSAAVVRVTAAGAAESAIGLSAGINFVSVPVMPSGARRYDVEDLARETGSTAVSWTVADALGKGRFRTWIRGQGGTAPPVEGSAGYVLVRSRQQSAGRLPFSGLTWPPADRVRALAQGLNLLGYPAGPAEPQDARALAAAAGSRYAVRWEAGVGGRGQAQLFLDTNQAVSFPLQPGGGYLVSATRASLDLGRLQKTAPVLAALDSTFSYDLQREWNLVGLALDQQPEIAKASALALSLTAGGARITRVLRWNGAALEEFVPPAAGVDFPVKRGEGYFVLNEGDAARIAVSGADPGGATLALAAGFNVIAAPVASPVLAGDLVTAVRALGSELASVSNLGGSRFLNHLPDAPDVSSPISLQRGGGAVVYATKAVVLRLGTPPGPVVTTVRLPDAILGVPYSAALGARGTAPIAWSVVSGALPPGLTLAADGTLGGTPASAVEAAFTARATNLDGTAEAPYRIGVFAQPRGLALASTSADGLLTFRNATDSSELIAIPPSAFMAGSTTASVESLLALTNEAPLHPVTLGRFVIGRTEVTNAQYAAFLRSTSDPAGPTLHQGHHPEESLYKDHTPTGWDGAAVTPWSTSPQGPVVGVDWYDAYAYAAWAGVRLPTEAEFEFAARGMDRRTFPWGEETFGAAGVYRANGGQLLVCCSEETADGFQYAAPAGSYGPGAAAPRGNGTSPFGVLDLMGNVWEWGFDWYGSYGGASAVNPAGPLTGASRVIKGGGYFSSIGYVRGAYRGFDDATARYGSYGFRVARSVEPVVVTKELAPAQAGSPFAAAIVAAGSAPVGWSLISGTLPSGVTLTAAGILSGTPGPAGAFPFLARARSADGFAEWAYLLRVDPAGTTFVTTNSSGYRELLARRDGSTLIEIPPATLAMGNTTASVAAGEALSNETPVHSVSSPRVLMGKFEVTNQQYAAFLNALADPAGPIVHVGHHPDEPAYKDHTPSGWTGVAVSPWSTSTQGPVAGVDWYDAWAYCAWAGARMPTEAEQELLARGVDGRKYPWGSTAPGTGGLYRANGGAVAVCCTEDSVDGFLYAAPVGSYGAAATPPRSNGVSVFGALDTAGNVWEWGIDRYDATYYSRSPTISPAGATAGFFRVLRGGGFPSSGDYLRAAYRGFDFPASRLGSYGIRMARSVDPAILTTTLPPAVQGRSYSTTLSAAAATPVTWAVSSGQLPAGLTLSQAGVLSGTPSASSMARFTVRAGGLYGLDFRAYALHVDPPATTFLTVNAQGFREIRNDKDGSTLVEVPAGAFAMGSTTASVSAGFASTTEQPLHTASLSRFYIGKTEVTNAQYAQFLSATGDAAGPTQHQGHHAAEPANKDHTPASWTGTAVTPWSTSTAGPVVNVDWYDAYAYCAWAGLSLPSEAQSELAARGVASRSYPWGEEIPGTGGRHRGNWGNLDTCCSESAADGFLYAAPVGSYGPGAATPRADGSSPFGALDTVGNVWEWVADFYQPNYYLTSPAADPRGPSTGTFRGLRGGSWYTSVFFQRPTFRGYEDPASRFGTYGFRVAR